MCGLSALRAAASQLARTSPRMPLYAASSGSPTETSIAATVAYW